MSTATTTRDRGDFSGDVPATDVREAVREWWERVRGGDMGPLPAVLGLLVLCAVFSAVRPESFPTAINFANLLVQAGAICVLAMGLVFVLLLGEIDLSAGVTGGVCAGVMASLTIDAGLPWYLAVPAGVATGAVIGLLIGSLVSRLGIPSFVVTLAFFLGLQGITLLLIGQGGTVPVRDEVVVAIANRNVPVWLGWVLVLAAVAGYAATALLQHRRRAARGLARSPLALVLARVGALSLVLVLATWVLSLNRARVATVELRGIPWVVPLVAVLLLLWTFVLARTAYGRHVYAVGGNAEAARRAGIDVRRIRTSVFVIASSMAAVSGIISASRLNSVTPDAGAGNTLLYAVGAAVIGGTSLFGGKGRARDAVIGGLVIAVIDNGLGLLGFASYVNFLVTGSVLLLAAGVDAVSRRRRAATGH